MTDTKASLAERLEKVLDEVNMPLEFPHRLAMAHFLAGFIRRSFSEVAQAEIVRLTQRVAELEQGNRRLTQKCQDVTSASIHAEDVFQRMDTEMRGMASKLANAKAEALEEFAKLADDLSRRWKYQSPLRSTIWLQCAYQARQRAQEVQRG